ncbi:MAG: transcriptional repressor LexA [Anaerolineae bacterium]|nr:transcriptional repressor LexA [Anaerolineae bacterium]
MSLSARQEKILSFIRRYLDKSQFPPTIREIGESVGITSTSVVNYNLNALEKKGFIERDKNVSRGLRLIDKPSTPARPAQPRQQQRKGIQLLGYIAAGEPIPIPDSSVDFSVMGDDEIISVPNMPQDADQMFALRVRGNSMIDALINDGDIVILRHQQEAHNGDMVAAWLKDERETTLKRFYLEGSRVRLQPANPDMKAMYFPAENIEIRGKVVMVIRELE